MLVVILTFFVVAFMVFFMMHFTDSSNAFDIVPSSANVNIESTGVEARKKPNGCLCRIHRLHESFLAEHSDLFTDMVNHYPTGRLVSAKLKDQLEFSGFVAERRGLFRVTMFVVVLVFMHLAFVLFTFSVIFAQ